MTPRQIPQQGAHTVSWQGRTNMLLGNVTLFEAASSHEKSGEFKAVWDTGATHTVISQTVVDTLELKPTGMIVAHTPQGSHTTNTYLVDLTFQGSGLNFEGFKVSLGILSGFDALIGMDIIGFGDFIVTNKDGVTIMSFRAPSMLRTDFVKELAQNKKAKWVVPNKKRRNKH